MTEYTTQEKAEATALQQAVRDLQAALAPTTPQLGSSSSGLLELMLSKAKKRIAELEKVEAAANTETKDKSVKELACKIKAESEAKLNAEERQQYEEFLGKEAFTKADFSKLERFYQSAWDRLSEDGRAEMSHRIWEGVRRNEYQFSELPDIVKQKEAQSLYDQLNSANVRDQNLLKIPEADRVDFTNAWSAGKREEAYSVLDRSSFAGNVALTTKRVVPADAVSKDDTKVAVSMEATRVEPTPKPKPASKFSELDYKMDDLLLVDNGEAKIGPPPLSKPPGGKAGIGQ